MSAAPEAPSAASLDSCERSVRERADDLDAYDCLWRRARQGQAEEVAERLERLLAAEPGRHAARLVLARLETDRGREVAEALYREAARGFERGGRTDGEVLAQLGLSAFFVRRGRFDEAARPVEQAEGVALRSGDRLLLARVRSQRGWLAHQKGDFSEAWRLFKEVEAEAVPHGPLDLQALCLSGLGAVAQETGQLQVSLAYLRRQAEASHRLGDFYDEARASGNVVITAFRLAALGQMEPEEIEPLARQALAAATAAANPGSIARAHLYLGDLTQGLEARQHYQRGLELGRQVQSLTSIVLGLRGLALSLVESEPRDPATAFRTIDEAIVLARGSPYYLALVHAARALMRGMTGPRDRAVADSLAALEAAEAIRDRQDDTLARARVFSYWTFPYYRLAGRLLASADLLPAERELAFAVTERMRARVLLDELDAAHATASLIQAGTAGSLPARRSEILRKVVAVQRRLLDPSLPSAQRETPLRELERLELEESGLRAALVRADPAFGALRAPRVPTLAELRGLLSADEALLSMVVAPRRNPDNRTTEGGSWTWVLTRDDARVYPLPDREELRPAVSLFLGLVQRRDGSEARSGPYLYHRLLGPALEGLPATVRRLIIIPDGPLHRLPMSALRSSPGSAPLAERYAITYVPSATLWARWRRNAAVGRPTALVLADPPQRLGPLPYARREAQSVARHLGPGTEIRVGPAATEAFFKQAGPARFGLLHLAVHAVVDEDHPERSGVLLAAGDPEQDGLLQIREIVSLELRDSVVFLSACRTAAGVVMDGEGPLSLARGFFQAGSRTVVGSLWPVRDDEMQALVDGFYAAAAGGAPLAQALATAQRQQIRKGAPAAGWAGLVILGDGEARIAVRPPSAAHADRSSIVYWIVAVLAVLVLAAFVRRARKNEGIGPAHS